MTVFYLVRHGEADYAEVDARDYAGAARDWASLSPQGVRQAEEAAARLRSTGAVRIVSSPLTRALQTAAILARTLDLPVAVELDLHEWLPDRTLHYRAADVSARYAEMEACGGEWPEGEIRPWEPLSAVRDRAARALAAHAAGGPVIAVTHGIVIRALTGIRPAPGEVVEWVGHGYGTAAG